MFSNKLQNFFYLSVDVLRPFSQARAIDLNLPS